MRQFKDLHAKVVEHAEWVKARRKSMVRNLSSIDNLVSEVCVWGGLVVMMMHGLVVPICVVPREVSILSVLTAAAAAVARVQCDLSALVL